MLKSKLNQGFEEIINLMGEQVSFKNNLKIDTEFHTLEVQGTVTDIILSLDGNHQISVDSGEFFVLSEVIEFNVLDPI